MSYDEEQSDELDYDEIDQHDEDDDDVDDDVDDDGESYKTAMARKVTVSGTLGKKMFNLLLKPRG